MKKALILFSLLVFSVTIFSCKKKYRCVCEEGNVVNAYLDKLSKSEADSEKTKCESVAGCTFERDKK